jgi:two-component system, sensor histidine kinase and response regulator
MDGSFGGGILIVEDEPLIGSYISHVLQAFSFSVAGCASSGSEALALAAEHRPRLAVVDIQISGAIDGIEVARALRDLYGIPSLFLSGLKDAETMQRARAVAVAEILRKPFLPSELLDAIQRVLAPRPPPEIKTLGTELLTKAQPAAN